MNSKVFFLLTLLSVLFTCTIASAQVQEEITLSTYYPAPYGEYEEMAAEKLFVDKQIIGNMDVDGDGDFSDSDDVTAMNVGTLLVENNVGIGTAIPGSAFDLNGAFSIRGMAEPSIAPAGQGRIYFDSTSNNFKVSSDGGAYTNLAGGAFWAATGNHIYNANTGNVGIGTNNPGNYKLFVNGATKIQNGNLALLDASTTAISSGPSILLGATPVFQKSSSYSGIHRRTISGTTCTQFTSGIAEVMVLTDAGNVGIGTTSPALAKLQINSNGVGSPPRLLVLENNNAQDDTWRWVDFIRGTTDSEFIVYGSGNVRADGSFTAPADYAEYFYSDDTDLRPGELISIAGENKVKRCNKGEVLIGVASTKPGLVGVYADDVTDAAEEYEKDPHYVKVGLLGQIPIKVSVANGTIKPGDQLTIGDNGIAVKGESPRTLLILALEDATKDAVIRALVK